MPESRREGEADIGLDPEGGAGHRRDLALGEEVGRKLGIVADRPAALGPAADEAFELREEVEGPLRRADLQPFDRSEAFRDEPAARPVLGGGLAHEILRPV